MLEEGLLASRPLDPELGAISRHVLTLGPAARASLPPSWRHPDPWSEPRWMLEHRLQRTHVSVLLGPEGWEWTARGDVFDALRRAALGSYRGRALNGTDHTFRRRLEHHAPVPMPCNALVQRSTGRLMLILEARPNQRTGTSIGRLPAPLLQLAGRFEPVDVAFLCADPALTAEAHTALARAIERRRLPLTVRPLQHFRELPHPRHWTRLDRSRFAENGLSSPFPYRRPARCAT